MKYYPVIIVIITAAIIYFIVKYYFKSKYHKYLFVTSYFQISNNRKNSLDHYKIWINNFFKYINSSLVIFTDNNKSSTSFVPSYVQAYKYEYKSIWDIPCIKKYKDDYKHQHEIDAEKYHHNPDVYAIWNSKICFLDIASNDIQSKLYIWIDIGTFRDPTPFNSIPSLKAMEIFYNFHSMFFFVINNETIQFNNKTELNLKLWIEGGSFGGNKLSIKRYYNEFWKLHDFFLHKNQFVGKDQYLYNTMALYITNVTLIKVHDLEMCMWNVWWRYQCFYAGMNLDLLKDSRNLYIKRKKNM